MKNYLFLLALIFPLSSRAACDNYCVGVRGNGEAEPAHLAGLSRMVEEFGMPKAMAGGSSATVTMFLSEQVKANAHSNALDNPEQKRKMQALMLKTMPEFMAAMTKDAKIADGFGMIQAFGGVNKDLINAAVEAFKNAGSLSSDELKAALAKYGSLLNPELVKLVQKDPSKFASEAEKSILNLGKFNAVTDDTLFFRPGLVDFKGVAVVVGYMADFYAGNTDAETKAKFEGFLDECSEKAFRKEWGDVDSGCKEKFQKIAADYLKAGKFANKAVFERVGAHGDSLPTTSLIQGDGVKKYNEMKRKYEAGEQINTDSFSLDIEKKEIGFGYWGKRDELAAVSKGLEKFREEGDLKAKSFKSLGGANWFEVLATSPAEPGIANAQRIPTNTSRDQVLRELAKPMETRWQEPAMHYRKDVISAGGWSDLHPTNVLKVHPGCERTLFLTRQGAHGDSKFGQQIFIRLTASQKEIPFWEKIGEGGPGGWCADRVKEENGDPATVSSTPWHKISNLCNPQSSFRRALDSTDATYCTDWDNDKYDVFKGNMRALVKHSYEAPLIPNTPAAADCKLNSQPSNLDPRALPGCLPYAKRQPGSRPVAEPDDNNPVPAR